MGDKKKTSPHQIGLCIFGYLENLGIFVREGYFPYIKDTAVSSTAKCSIERHIDSTVYSGMIDDNRLGMSLIFRLSNSFDYLDNISTRIKSTVLYGFCADGKNIIAYKKDIGTDGSLKAETYEQKYAYRSSKTGG